MKSQNQNYPPHDVQFFSLSLLYDLNLIRCGESPLQLFLQEEVLSKVTVLVMWVVSWRLRRLVRSCLDWNSGLLKSYIWRWWWWYTHVVVGLCIVVIVVVKAIVLEFQECFFHPNAPTMTDLFLPPFTIKLKVSFVRGAFLISSSICTHIDIYTFSYDGRLDLVMVTQIWSVRLQGLRNQEERAQKTIMVLLNSEFKLVVIARRLKWLKLLNAGELTNRLRIWLRQPWPKLLDLQ